MKNTEWKEKRIFVEELKRQWRLLWRERIEDRVRAEGIADRDFSLLSVERGTVIIATKDYKPLDFKQVLQQHKLVDAENVVFSNPEVGGWGKFAREALGKSGQVRRQQSFMKPAPARGPSKKCGKGWLHTRL